MRLVAAAQASGSRSQALADRAAALLFYVAIVAGATTFVYWWLSGDKEHALIRAATVLIIALPARTWIGDPPCHCNFDVARRTERSARQG